MLDCKSLQMPGDSAAAATVAASPNLADKLARRAANKRCAIVRPCSLWVSVHAHTARRCLQGACPASMPHLREAEAIARHVEDDNSSASHAAINGFCGCDPRLVEQFGSTRRKRQLTAQEMGAVNPESIGAV